MGTDHGWICPKCGRCYAPFCTECAACNGAVEAAILRGPTADADWLAIYGAPKPLIGLSETLKRCGH